MVEPLTLTASVIANLAFQKFLESGAGELGKKFTTEAIAAMDSLRKKLWDRLRGKSEKLDQALAQAEQGDKKALETIAKNLDVVMDDDQTFATEIKTLAQQIQAGKIQDNSNMTQNVSGDHNTNIQAKAEQGGTNYNAQNINVYHGKPD
jgi:anthranilate/para-aminobenzoate synthase component I